ncbi:MAG: hypothetical protein M3Q36_02660 [bacterium]|nr:hypothetical protein [bacterium]
MKTLVNNLKNNTLTLMILIAAVAMIGGFLGMRALAQNNKPVQASSCIGTCVELTAGGISQNEIAVKIGEYVQFNSADGQTHNFALGEGTDESKQDAHDEHGASHDHNGSYSSGDFGADEAWRVQFNQVGTYRLHDHHNPELEILVVVYDPSNQSSVR